MRVKLWTSLEDGVVTANVEVSNFTASEKTQANKFGPLQVNLGGAFAELVAPDQPQVNFSLEPINFLIDPASQSQATYQRIFKSTAEVLNPSVAAKVFCDACFSKLSDSISKWKNLADPYATSYDSVL